MLLVCVSIVFCTLALCFWFKRPKTSDPPILRGAWPLFGHLHLLAGDGKRLANVLQTISLETIKSGGVTTLYLGPLRLHVIADPEDAETAANICLDKHYLYKFGKSWLGEGLVVANLTTWKRNRKLLNPAFGQQVSNSFIGEFNSQAERLVKKLSVEVGKGPFLIDKYIAINNLETICKTALGMNSEENSKLFNDYRTALDQIFEIYYERMKNLLYHVDAIYNWSPLKKVEDKLIKSLHSVSNMVIKHRKTEILQNSIEGKDCFSGKYKPFMNHILALSDEKGFFSDTEIREQTDNIIVGGHDTIAISIIYIVLLLGSYPEVQDKVYTEIREVIGDRDIEKDDLSKLVYLEAVIKESMRLYSIAPVLARDIDTDLKLKNYTLRPGTSCLIMVWGLHHHPVWGPDVYEFKPDRWLDPSRLPECSSAFAAFSLGKRGCIGRVYAMMSMKTNIAYLIRQYRFKSDVSKLEVKFDIMLKPASGHEISLELRN